MCIVENGPEPIDDKSALIKALQAVAWAISQQANTWVNVETNLCHHMTSLDHSELTTGLPQHILLPHSLGQVPHITSSHHITSSLKLPSVKMDLCKVSWGICFVIFIKMQIFGYVWLKQNWNPISKLYVGTASIFWNQIWICGTMTPHPGVDPLDSVNSLAPGRSECDSKNVIFNLLLLIGIFRSSHDNAIRWMPPDLTDDQSTLVQVMAWCRQAASHYLSQCWLSSLSPYGMDRPQCVKLADSL